MEVLNNFKQILNAETVRATLFSHQRSIPAPVTAPPANQNVVINMRQF